MCGLSHQVIHIRALAFISKPLCEAAHVAEAQREEPRRVDVAVVRDEEDALPARRRHRVHAASRWVGR